MIERRLEAFKGDNMIIYLDMDGVLANIHKEIGLNTGHDKTPSQILEKGFYRGLEVMPGARGVVNYLLDHPEIELFIASKTPKGNLHCATEKYEWIQEHFPRLLDRIMLVCDKTKLIGDYLIDDDSRWKDFNGEFIHFDFRNPIYSWRNAENLIKENLKNSQQLDLKQDYEQGVYIYNNTNTQIKKIVVKQGVLGRRTFEGVGPGESCSLFKPEIFEDDWRCHIISVEWVDGIVKSNFELTT